MDCARFSSIFEALKRQYQELKNAEPGHRFQEFHERQAKESPARKPIILAIAVLLLVAGLALMVLPGPGIPVLVVACALFAQEMPIVARALDAGELQVRRLFGSREPKGQ